MKFGKVLRNTAMASAIALMSLGAISAYASTNGGDGTTTLIDGVFHAHVGASVIGTTTMVEHDAVSFGNLAVTGTGKITLSAAGVRAVSTGTGITLLDGTYSGQDSVYGAARAGSYTITGDPNATVYVTYFVTGGGGTFVSTNNTNAIHLTHGTDPDLLVYNLVDDGHKIVAGDNDVYAGDAVTSIALDGSGVGNLHIGGTLEATAADSDGAYRGTFDIMLHY